MARLTHGPEPAEGGLLERVEAHFCAAVGGAHGVDQLLVQLAGRGDLAYRDGVVASGQL